MSNTVAQMSKRELTHIISSVVEQKLIELFGDPDEDLLMKENFRKRLLRQKKAVAKGDRGTDLISIRKQLEL
jgi:hypothetical protein